MALVLYWRPGSAAMAPHAALAELGLDYRLARIEREQAQTDPAYLALNPLGVVPTLVDEESGAVLTESAAILLALGERYPDARLAPTDRAEYYRWLVFLTNTVQTSMLRFFYPERYGETDAVRAAGARDAQRAFDVVEAALDGREWLAADHRTGADLFLFMVTRWGRQLTPPVWDRPRLRAHFLRTLALPGVARMIDEQGLELPPWAGTDRVLKIARAEDWAAAKESGVYRVPSLEEEGFIHLSRPHQVHIPANALYSDTSGLVLLWIDPTRLTAEIREEPGTSGEPMDFPHLYGPLNADAVVAESPLEPWKNGEFQLPAEPA